MPGAGGRTQAKLIFGNIQLSGHMTEPAELQQHYIRVENVGRVKNIGKVKNVRRCQKMSEWCLEQIKGVKTSEECQEQVKRVKMSEDIRKHWKDVSRGRVRSQVKIRYMTKKV